MESSPLTQAHLHARNAVTETQKCNPVAASEEHDLAAGEFAHAAQITGDPEALRTLKLLEEYHKKLAQILKFRNEHPPIPKASEASPPSSPPPAFESSTPTKAPLPHIEPAHQPPRLPTQNRVPHRDLTSSIASNLASARGIPSNQQRRGAPASPTLSAQHAGGRVHSGAVRTTPGETIQRKESGQGPANDNVTQLGPSRSNIPPSLIPPSNLPVSSPTPRSPPQREASTEDEPFQRFYATFEGLISKLSAPLAFAGLPLSSPMSTHPPDPPALDRNSKPKQPTTSTGTQPQDPDLTKLISRAALRAVKDTNSPGSFGYNAAESFYVVPTTGGTISYAGILSRAEQESLRQQKRHQSPDPNNPAPFFKELSDDEGDTDFVDARETPIHQSPELNKPRHGRSKSGGASTVGGKTMEELHLENTALKHLSDTLSKRLHMWEVNSQSSSAVLQQSIRALQNSPKAVAVDAQPVSAQGQGGTDGSALKRLQELEETLKRVDAEKESVARENEKLKTVVSRYRDRWEKLKEGARVRREGTGPGTANPSGAGGEGDNKAFEGEI